MLYFTSRSSRHTASYGAAKGSTKSEYYTFTRRSRRGHLNFNAVASEGTMNEDDMRPLENDLYCDYQ
ncbi:hypothetical protein P3342_002077 [Pyrenophora teres f. teres]|nr:hypothetical protein P3342_002077 [Pyrenophora teres f. teres]